MKLKSFKFIVVCITIISVLLFYYMGENTDSNLQAGKKETDQSYVAVAKGRVDVEGGVVQLAAKRDGVINEVYVEEGDPVKKGQVLAVLDNNEAKLSHILSQSETKLARAQLEPLKVKLEAAIREKTRLVELNKNHVVSQKELDQIIDQIKELNAEIAVNEASAKVCDAKEKIAEYEVEQRVVRAPLDGFIIRRMARPGDGASTLNVTPLFWFVPKTPHIIRAELDENFVRKVKKGMQAEIVPEADESQKCCGKVIRLGHIFGPKRQAQDDPQERADVRVIECVLSLDNQDLLIGQRVYVKFKE